MQFVRRFGRFWSDFIIGDDPLLALGVVLILAMARVLDQSGIASAAWLVGPIGVAGVLAVSLVRAISPDGGAE